LEEKAVIEGGESLKITTEKGVIDANAKMNSSVSND